MSTEQLSKKDAAYLAKLQADAADFQSATEVSDAQLEELRRWEGPEAARAAAEARAKGPGYTRISEAAPAQAAAPASGRTNTFAILALVFALFGSVLGIVFGHIALSQIDRTGEQGRGLATAGLVIGYAGVALIAIVLLGSRIAVGV